MIKKIKVVFIDRQNHYIESPQKPRKDFNK